MRTNREEEQEGMRRNQYIPRPMDPDVLMIRQACKVVLVQASTAEDRSAEGIAGPPISCTDVDFRGDITTHCMDIVYISI